MRGFSAYVLTWLVLLALGSPASAQKLPATVDIAQSKPNVTIYGAAKTETITQFGALATGDFNGDGIADVAVGAVNSNGPNEARTHAGAVYIFYGKKDWPGELDLALRKDGKPPADLVIYGADPFDHLGYAIGVGDIDGDQVDDLIVSAINADGPEERRIDTGEVYIFFGKSSLSSSGIIDLRSSDSDVQIYGAETGNFTGSSLAAGDVNGDQIDDLIIGAQFGENGRGNSGAVYVLFGQTQWAKKQKLDLTEKRGDLVILGIDPDDQLGSAVASADVNGDGFDDLILAAPLGDGPQNRTTNAGEVYLVFGRSFAKGTSPAVIDLRKTAPDLTIYGADIGDRLGQSLGRCLRRALPRKCFDLDNDGFEELVMGVPYGDGPKNARVDAGEVVVFLGKKNWPAVIDLADPQAKPGMILYGRKNADRLGASVATGDINGDTFNDLLIGADLADGPSEEGPSRVNSGEVYLVYGAKTLPPIVDVLRLDAPGPDATVVGAAAEDGLGHAVAVGDLNGDGFADLVIGAFDADGPMGERTNAGAVYLLYGIGPKPVVIRATKQSRVLNATELTAGGTLAYTITVKNEGRGEQTDNAGNEFVDPLPLGVTIDRNALQASHGKIDYDAKKNLVTWNGGLLPQQSVTIAFRVTVDPRPGEFVIRNQGRINYDSDGDGVNDAIALTNIVENKVAGRRKGDLNLDGVIDLTDAQLVAEFIVGSRELSEEQKWAADVAEPCRPTDQHIDVTDVRRIAEYALGVPTSFGCQELTRWQAEEFFIERAQVLLGPARGGTTVVFSALGQGILSIQVQVFDLTGREVFLSGWVPNGLAWNLRTRAGRPLARGVYLYTVWVRGPTGEIRTGVGKFLIRR